MEHAPPQRHHSWDACLASLGDGVEAARASLRDPSADTSLVLDAAALDARAPLSRLEPADAARAEELLHALHRLVGELEAARDRLAREMRLHRTLRAGRRADTAPLYLDDRC